MAGLQENTNAYANLIANGNQNNGANSVGAYLTSLNTNIATHTTNLATNQSNLREIAASQNVMYTMTQNESDRLDRKKKNVDQALDGQNRMITLNDSYVKKYAKYNQIIMVIVLVILVIFGAIMLGTYVPAIPSVVNDLIMILAVGIGLIVIYNIYMDIQRRDSLYFDKLKLSTPDVSGNIDLSSNDINSDQAFIFSGGCFGEDCCGDPPMHFINGMCRNPPNDIWDYANNLPKQCTTSACSGTSATDVLNKTWTWDSENSRWINGALNQYWNFDTNEAQTIPVLQDAPTQGFTNIDSISTIDNYESGYTSYR